MNEEDGFHKVLDDNIEDHLTRTILADFLQDRGDLRASGYRELGTNQLTPTKTIIKRVQIRQLKGYYWAWRGTVGKVYKKLSTGDNLDLCLPIDLWNLLSNYLIKVDKRVYYFSRREAEDAFARAFAIYTKPILQS